MASLTRQVNPVRRSVESGLTWQRVQPRFLRDLGDVAGVGEMAEVRCCFGLAARRMNPVTEDQPRDQESSWVTCQAVAGAVAGQDGDHPHMLPRREMVRRPAASPTRQPSTGRWPGAG